MTHAVIQQLLNGIKLRERQLAEQVDELAGRLREAEAEREALQTTAKTIRAVAASLDLEQPPAPVLPDGAAYQQIMDVFDHEHRPLGAATCARRWTCGCCRNTSKAPVRNSNAWSASGLSTRSNPDCSNSPARRHARLPSTSAADYKPTGKTVEDSLSVSASH